MPVAGYLASGILTLVIPLGLVLLVGVVWIYFVRTDQKDL